MLETSSPPPRALTISQAPITGQTESIAATSVNTSNGTSLRGEVDNGEFRRGVISAIAAFACWGLFPIYWKWLAHVPSVELVCHRIVWSFTFLAIVLGVGRYGGRRRNQWVSSPRFGMRVWAIYSLAAALISVNWFVFIWAINHGHVIEASLGYYINPLFSVLLGVVCVGERLTKPQWTSIGIAMGGVIVMALASGVLPWVSLALAASFSLYGLVKKSAPLAAMSGLLIETSVLLLPAAAYILWSESAGVGPLSQAEPRTIFLLLLGGGITVLPLALFATAAQRIPLTLVGILQYIGPTLQFALGAFAFGEPFGPSHAVGFLLVWIGSSCYLALSARALAEQRRVQ